MYSIKEQIDVIFKSIQTLGINPHIEGKLYAKVYGHMEEFDRAIEEIKDIERSGYNFQIREGLSVTISLN